MPVYAVVNFLFQIELRKMDEKLLQELDEKVADQQATMQSAGMPAFYVTKDPKVGSRVIRLQKFCLQEQSQLFRARLPFD